MKARKVIIIDTETNDKYELSSLTAAEKELGIPHQRISEASRFLHRRNLGRYHCYYAEDFKFFQKLGWFLRCLI